MEMPISAGQPWWVFFKDKGPTALQKPVVLSSETWRRLNLRGRTNPWLDIPVYQNYLDSLRDLKFTIRTTSRWLNAASVEVPALASTLTLAALSFVKDIRPLARGLRHERLPVDESLWKSTAGHYGESLLQNELLNLPVLHTEGWNGAGVIIAIFDAGFTYANNPVFSSLLVDKTYDFVAREITVDGSYSSHGTACLGLIGGYLPNYFIGAAYQARFLLARTEDATSETPAEEDNWVAALEWADANGADIISSSLVYRDFDPPANSYPPSAMDGQTAVITIATDTAATRGILVVNAMGNEGPDSLSLWAPADGRHVLSVGAINAGGLITSFSSRGPTADGRIKPEVVTLGEQVYLPKETSGFQRGDGTSFATPMIAGAAALVLQSNPHLTPDSVIALFRSAGDQFSAPNITYGWGVPNVKSIVNLVGPGEPLAGKPFVAPNPIQSGYFDFYLGKNRAADTDKYKIYNLLGQLVAQGNIELISPGHTRIKNTFNLPSGIYFIQVRTKTEAFNAKFLSLRNKRLN